MPQEHIIRLSFFLGTLGLVAVWEVIAPRRSLTDSKGWRWLSNLALVIINTAAVLLIGPPAVAVVIFEVVLNAMAQFNHGNIRIPEKVDRWLRLVIVTPDMHRVHHSIIPRETNSNFGFNIPWWDRLCGTYRPQPELGHTGMSIGLKEYRDPAKLKLPSLLIQPFL